LVYEIESEFVSMKEIRWNRDCAMFEWYVLGSWLL